MQPTTQYPVQFSVDYPDRALNRLTTAFRIFVVIPIAIVLGCGVGRNVAVDLRRQDLARWRRARAVCCFSLRLLMILFRRKYPRWWFDWNLELQRFGNRVGVYVALMDDRYPSTDDHQSVHLDYPYPDAARELNRWLPLVKWFLAIPHYIVLFFLEIAAFVVVVIAWFAILFTGRYPRGHVRLRRGRHPLAQPGDRLRLGPGHRPVPAVPPRRLTREQTPLARLRPVWPVAKGGEDLLGHGGVP